MVHQDEHGLTSSDHPDVDVSGLADEQVLAYDQATGKWVNVDVSVSDPPMAKMYKAAVQSIPKTTWTKMTFDSSAYDTGSLIGANRFDISVAGVYSIKCGMGFFANTTGIRFGRITKNVTVTSLLQLRRDTTSKLLDHCYWSMAVDAKLAIDDYVEFWLYQNTGANLNSASGLMQHWASIFRVGDG